MSIYIEYTTILCCVCKKLILLFFIFPLLFQNNKQHTMVVSNDDDRVPKPMVIVKNLPNGSPCLSATHDFGIKVHQDNIIHDCHEVLLSNHKYAHGKINDMFTNCLSIYNQHTSLKLSKLKHCSISFEKNLDMLGASDEG